MNRPGGQHSRSQPGVRQNVAGINLPAPVTERQVDRPDQFAEVKPNRPACNEHSNQWVDCKGLPDGVLVIAFKPDAYDAHCDSRNEEGRNLKNPPQINPVSLKP